MRSEVQTLHRWLDRLPDDVLQSRPDLCFYHAWTLAMRGVTADQVEARLQTLACPSQDTAEAALHTGRRASLRAYLSVFQGDWRRANRQARLALDHLPESDGFWRSTMSWILSLTRLLEEDPQDGFQTLQELVDAGHAAGNPLVVVNALCYQAKLQARQGHLHHAHEILERALALATGPDGQRLPIASEPLIALGDLEREWNHLEAAEEYLLEAIELGKQWSKLSTFDAFPILARLRLAMGDAEAAHEALENARNIALGSEITRIDDLLADLHTASLAAVQGDAKTVLAWARERGLVPSAAPVADQRSSPAQDYISEHLLKYEQIILARFYIHQGQSAEALALLDPLLDPMRSRSRIDLVINIQILRALALQAAGSEREAIHALSEALAAAEPGGYVRVFLDEGLPLAGLLRQAASRGIAPAYVAALEAGAGGPEPTLETSPASTTLLEPLSPRELDVLRLMAAGLSNPEIADELVIAVSTVRSHCKSIYGKLAVHRRWDAVLRAQALELI
jgi:LuxR family maltose regulon positive regulatory protein